MIKNIKKTLRHFFLFIVCLFLLLPAWGCGGGGGDDTWDFIDIFVSSINQYKSTPVWETWRMTSLVLGDDGKDYSFSANLVITRNGNDIIGFGNANGYPLGAFLVTGTRTGDSIEFEIASENRYRAFSLIGKGIYINSNSEIGGNSIKGEDFLTIFDDPVNYDGNFHVHVEPLTMPVSDGVYSGNLNGSYDSIENGEITLLTNEDGSIITVGSIKGNLVGSNQTEGVFEIDDPTVLGESQIQMNRFSVVGVNGNDTIEVAGAISGEIASGIIIYQRNGKVYIGAFSALLQ